MSLMSTSCVQLPEPKFLDIDSARDDMEVATPQDMSLRADMAQPPADAPDLDNGRDPELKPRDLGVVEQDLDLEPNQGRPPGTRPSDMGFDQAPERFDMVLNDGRSL